MPDEVDSGVRRPVMTWSEVQALRRHVAGAVPEPRADDPLGGFDVKRPLDRRLVLDGGAEVQDDRHPNSIGLAEALDDPRLEGSPRRERAEGAAPRDFPT